jgi:hypothetical protein
LFFSITQYPYFWVSGKIGAVQFGDNGKYKVTFAAKAEQIKPIPFGSAKSGAMQGPRFTTKTALSGSEDLGDIL